MEPWTLPDVAAGPSRRRTAAAIVLVVALVVAVALVSYTAGTFAVQPPAIPTVAAQASLYIVSDGEVEQTIGLTTSASWAVTQTVNARAPGVVTSIRSPASAPVESGDTVATVDLRPVIVATGEVPMFRAMRVGMRGADVVQLKRFLVAEGYLRTATGSRFDAQTQRAVRAWQRVLQVNDDGVVRIGDLLFVRDLPARMVILLVPGDSVVPDSPFISVLGAKPTFTAVASSEQRSQLVTGMPISIVSRGGGTWYGRLGPFVPLDDGRFSAAVDGKTCGEGCSAVALEGETAMTSQVQVTPPVSGPVVPASALLTGPDGSRAVRLADGSRRDVTVLGSADGFAVVDGVKAGEAILLPVPPIP